MVKLDRFEMRTVSLPLRKPFRTSFGTVDTREAILVRAVSEDAEGWGECVSMPSPAYSSEFNASSMAVLRRHLLPALLRAETLSSARCAELMAAVRGHRMAKAAAEMAILDAELRLQGATLARHLGAVRDQVPCGVSIGIAPTINDLLDQVEQHLAAGYRRVKLKVEPGWDLEPVAAVRGAFGEIKLQVDANAAYQLADKRHLARLDDYDLAMIEQPLAPDDLLGHARLAECLKTPICLDESIESARDAATAIALGACSVINVKPGRVGGYLEARRVGLVAAAHGIPTWCGGMLETGLGRAANVALSALPAFTEPGDTSASDRYWEQDLTLPLAIDGDGYMDVPTGAGLGVEPLPDVLAALTVDVEQVVR